MWMSRWTYTELARLPESEPSGVGEPRPRWALGEGQHFSEESSYISPRRTAQQWKDLSLALNNLLSQDSWALGEGHLGTLARSSRSG